MNSIKDIDLLRIFEIYDKDKNTDKVWFKDVKTVTNNELQFVIPINSENGLIMSTYTELHNSKYWMKLYNDNKNKLKNILNNKLSNTFNKDIPNSKWLNYIIGIWVWVLKKIMIVI